MDKVKTRKGWFRYKVWIPALAVTLMGVLYFLFLFDGHIKFLLEKTAGTLHGAEVNVGQVNTDLIKESLTLTMGPWQVTDPKAPQKNRLEVKEIVAQISWKGLWRGKMVIPLLSFSTISFDTQRKRTGWVKKGREVSGREGPPAWKEIQASVGKKDLEKMAATLDKDFSKNLSARLDLVKNLKSAGEVQRLQEELKAMEVRWERADPVAQVILVERLGQEIKRITLRLEKLDDLIAQDRKLLEEAVNLPKIEVEGIAKELFGAMVVAKMGDFYQWVNWARKPDPPPRERTAFARNTGEKIYFEKPGGLPAFWLKKGVVTASEFGVTLTDFSTQPSLVSAPTVLSASGNFRDQDIRGVNIRLKMDHRGAVPTEDLMLTIGRYPLRKTSWIQSSKINLGLNKAFGQLELRGKIRGEEVDFTINHSFRGVDFHLKSESQIFRQLMEKALAQTRQFRAEIRFVGTWKNPHLMVASDLAEIMKKGLENELKENLSKGKKLIETTLRKRVEEPKEKLLAQFEGLGKKLKDVGTKVGTEVEKGFGKGLLNMKNKLGL